LSQTHRIRQNNTKYRASRICDFLYVNNSIWHAILHRFRDTADYWSTIRCRQEITLFNAPVRNEPLNLWPQNLASRN